MDGAGTLYSPYDWIEQTIGNRRLGALGESGAHK